MQGNLISIDVKDILKENGKYYIWVVDTAGNASYMDKEITKIDNIAPTIDYVIDDSKKDTEKYVTITVTSKDEESGLNEMPYSWDKQSWGIDNNVLKVTENGTYTIYVRDALENISEKNIKISSLPKEGTAEIDTGSIIKSISVSSEWTGKKNNEVTITFNDNLSVANWKITTSDEIPTEFLEEDEEEDTNNTINNEEENIIEENTTSETNTNVNTSNGSSNSTESSNSTRVIISDNSVQGHANLIITVSLEEKQKYYIWIKDTSGNITSQGFTIKKATE